MIFLRHDSACKDESGRNRANYIPSRSLRGRLVIFTTNKKKY